MSFLNPLFLIALITVAVPLLIYLLNLRKPKKVRFSTLAFFESLKTTALKRIRIKRWLLLAIRMLAIVALVMAASRPFLPSGLGIGSENEPKAVAVLIDNSPAMVQIDRNGPYIEQALNNARDIISSFDSEDRFLLNVTHGEPLNTPFLTRANALSRISDIEPVNKGNYLAERLFRLKDQLEQAREPNKIIYLVTSARQSHYEDLLNEFGGEKSDVQVQVVKLGAGSVLNTGVKSVDIQTASIQQGGRVQLRTVIENYSGQIASNQFLSFLADDELISQQPFELEPGGTSEYLFDLPETDQKSIKVEFFIEGDELVFDNRYYAAVQLPKTTRVLVVEDGGSNRVFNSYLKPLLDVADAENDQYNIDFEDLNDLRVSNIFNYDAIILDGIKDVPDYLSQPILDHVQSGAGLFLLPAADGNLNSYNRFLNLTDGGQFVNVIGSYGSFNPVTRMAVPQEGHPIIDSIFDKDESESIQLNIPDLFYYYEIESGGGTNIFPVIRTVTGNILMQEARVGNGRIIYTAFGTDPGWSNFPIKPFFAPFFFRTVEYLAQGEAATLNSYSLGKPFRTVIPHESEILEIEKDEDQIIPNIRQTFQGTEVSYSAQEWGPGWAEIKMNDETILFSVNQDAMESQLKTLNETEIREILNAYFNSINITILERDNIESIAQLERASFGREIWFWFIIAAIILLIAESVVSRSYKAESIA